MVAIKYTSTGNEQTEIFFLSSLFLLSLCISQKVNRSLLGVTRSSECIIECISTRCSGCTSQMVLVQPHPPFWSTLHSTVSLHCTALQFTALHSNNLHCTALYFPALHCSSLHCIALKSNVFTIPHFTTLLCCQA